MIGKTISHYKIIEELGAGGMATVYLAVQEAFDRRVAVKVLSPKTAAEEDFAARFLREAKTVAQMTHQNIISVYDFGTIGDYFYMSMEQLPGGTLDDLLKAGLELSEVLEIIGQVASALDYAHKHKVVHRDIKPAVMV